MTSQPAARVEEGYDRGGLWAAILVMYVWHVASTLPFVIDTWITHGWAASGIAIWVVYLAIGTVSTRIALQGRRPSPALAAIICFILLAGVTIGALESPGGFLGQLDWPYTVSGWFALVTLWRRPLSNLLSYFASNALTGMILLAVMNEAGRPDIARFIIVSVGVSVLQITIFVGGKTVASMARHGAEAEQALAQIRIARLAAEGVQAVRRVNYETIGQTVTGLLERVAAGDLDPQDPAAYQQVAIAIGRLRRYLVEPDGLPDQLSHELAACAEAAERRGVAVDLLAPAGTVPQLPVGIRRGLTDPVIQVLSAAAHARITVVASAARVVVAIVADAFLPDLVRATHDDVEIAQEAESGSLWVQASWSAR